MSHSRSMSWLLAIFPLVLLASSATAQVWQPFGPIEYEHDLQPFAPANIGDFGEEPESNEGYFFSYERLNWSIMKPSQTPIGKAGLTRLVDDGNSQFTQTNTIDISAPHARFGWGNRYDMGYMDDGHGWLISVTDGPDQHYQIVHGLDPFVMQVPGIADDRNPIRDDVGDDGNAIPLPSQFANSLFTGRIFSTTDATTGVTTFVFLAGQGANGVSVVFTDPSSFLIGYADMDGNGNDDDIDGDGNAGRAATPNDVGDLVGPFPVYFDTVTVRNVATLDAVELMKSYRFKPLRNGSILEMYYGARYMQFEDRFTVVGKGGVLADSDWDTTAENNLVGPQVGAKWYHSRGRWKFNVESRFFAGWNIQNLSQNGTIASFNYPQAGFINIDSAVGGRPLNLFPTDFQHSRRREDFAPVAELRVETSYQLSKAVSLKVGWTGIFADNLSRASNLVDYTLPAMGLLDVDPQEFLSHGLNFGVEVNR